MTWLIIEAGIEIVKYQNGNPPAVDGYFVLDPVGAPPVLQWKINSKID